MPALPDSATRPASRAGARPDETSHHDDGSSDLGLVPPGLITRPITQDATERDVPGETRPLDPGETRPLDPKDLPRTLGSLEVLGLVGRGGMGVVLKARDPHLNRTVAVKTLAPELAADPRARRRFARESRAAASVSHPHVVTIHAVEPNGPVPFLVMEYVAGRSLRERLDAEGPLDLAEILRIGIEVAEGLEAAHARGLIHRDVKPGNVLLERGGGRVKLTDFGLARIAGDARITRSGEIGGTPQYMSPEQADGRPIDRRSDLFSLGGLLYAMCTGGPPFRGSSPVVVLRQVCDAEPRPIRDRNPAIPTWLVAVVDRLMKKDPSKRYQTAGEVARVLAGHLARFRNSDTFLRAGLPRPHHGRRYSPWAVTATLLVGASVGFGTVEATGVTEVVPSVVRLMRGDGTLVIQTDDPNVGVTVEGEDLVITGAGPREIRLSPGEYTVMAHKEGRPAFTQLVTVERNGREVVNVRWELGGTPGPGGHPKGGRSGPPAATTDVPWDHPRQAAFATHPPAFAADGLSLVLHDFFAGGLNGDVWAMTRPAIDAPWSARENVGPPVSDAGAKELYPFLTPDGLTLYFQSGREGSWGESDLWITRRPATDAAWGEPENLTALNGPTRDTAPHLSADGRTLLFASDRDGGAGDLDLWVSHRDGPDTPWSTPENLRALNSRYEDQHPTLSRDGLTLLFGSGRPGGSGGDDLWMSRRASAGDSFPTPVNLGPVVNSGGNERDPQFSAFEDSLWFLSYGQGGVMVTRELAGAPQSATAGPRPLEAHKPTPER